MDPVVATYADPASARRAIEGLLSAGVKRSEIAVISSVPLDDSGLGEEGKTAPMPWLVALGAILGGIGGYLLVSLTQQSYPIQTGGMPVVSLWTDGIVIYELTMLGAILSTLLVLFWTAPLLHWEPRPQGVFAIDNGKIALEVVPSSAEVKGKISAVLALGTHPEKMQESASRGRSEDTTA